MSVFEVLASGVRSVIDTSRLGLGVRDIDVLRGGDDEMDTSGRRKSRFQFICERMRRSGGGNVRFRENPWRRWM
jgi:hypothetical protein